MTTEKFKTELFEKLHAYEKCVNERKSGELLAIPSSLFSESIDDITIFVTDELKEVVYIESYILIESLCNKERLVFLDAKKKVEEINGEIVVTYYGWDIQNNCQTPMVIRMKPKIK